MKPFYKKYKFPESLKSDAENGFVKPLHKQLPTKSVAKAYCECYDEVEQKRQKLLCEGEDVAIKNGAKGARKRPRLATRSGWFPQVTQVKDIHMDEQKRGEAITLAAVNEKGGVTKTTSTANIAVMLSRLGFRVLAVDGDPQGHLTFTFGQERNTIEQTLYDVLKGTVELKKIIRPTYVDPDTLAFVEPDGTRDLADFAQGPDLVPINMRASSADGELRGKFTWPMLLRKALQPVLPLYDYILMDTNPSLGVLTVNALCAS